MILYADGSVLLCADKNLEYLKKKSENDFCKVEHWIRINKLSLNYSKTNLVLFPGMKNKSNCDDNFCVNTNNGPITPKSVIKYLGFFIDHKLTWKNHMQYVKEKLCTVRGIRSKLRYYAPIRFTKCIFWYSLPSSTLRNHIVGKLCLQIHHQSPSPTKFHSKNYDQNFFF